MTKMSKILFALWIVLALAAFVGAFFTPVLVVKIITLKTILTKWSLTLVEEILSHAFSALK